MLVPPGAQAARPFGGAGPSPTASRSSSRNDLFSASFTPSPPPPPLPRSNDLFSANWSPSPPPPPLPRNDLFSSAWSPSPPPLPLPRNDAFSSGWDPSGPSHDLTTPRRFANLALDSSPSQLPPAISHPHAASHAPPSHPLPHPPSHAPPPHATASSPHATHSPSHATPGPLAPPPLGAPPVSPPRSPDYPSGALLARRLAAAKGKPAMRDPLELDTTPPRTSSLTAASVELSPADSPRTPAETKYSPLAHYGDPVTNPASRPPSPPSPPQPVAAASKTSSFFASAGVPIPPPALANVSAPPSPLALSRAASLRRNGAGPGTSPSSPSYVPGHAHSTSHASVNSHLSVSPSDLSPLHQSPSLAPQYVPPTPPATDDMQLRLFAEPGYLLGEGRYATVYLAAYKKPPTSPPLSSTRANGEGSGWKLCAAKRLAPDRESQTMGLREAFFLNRLGTGKGRGQVHVVRLIAVKDDTAPSVGAPGAPTSPAYVPVITESRALQREMHSDSPPRRHRASTIYAGGRGADPEAPGGHAAIGTGPGPSVPDPSRLVLVVEHAPLGTLDRLLRSSPGLVGPQLWGRWAREATSALEWVHGKGVVHVDVKPSNLLLTADLHLRLSDFGSSLLIHPEHPPTDGVGLGTLPFSPPELVDPVAPFSFPVDIFALGATLYQCLTGREPYRGARPVEMMHYVRNGGLWQWLERDRLARVGTEGFFSSAVASPYPSAWRADPLPGAEVRRGGSLRVPQHSHNSSLSVDIPSTPLRRVGSAESIVASTDAGRSAEDSPAGVRLWAAWHHGRHNAVDRLLSDHPTSPPRSPLSRASSIRSPLRHVHGPDTNAQPDVVPALSPSVTAAGYADGSPAMFFLGAGMEGPARVPDGVRDVLRAMMEPAPEGRPCATEVLGTWDELGVGVGEDEEGEQSEAGEKAQRG